MLGIIAAVAAGSLLEAYSADQAAQRKAKEIEKAAEAQAKAFESTAAQTLQSGEVEASVARLKGANILGEARVIQGASRLEGGEDTLRKTAYMTSLDVGMIKMNARRAAWGLQDRALEARVSGQAAARAVRAEGQDAAYKALLSGGIKALSAYRPGGGSPEVPREAGNTLTSGD